MLNWYQTAESKNNSSNRAENIKPHSGSSNSSKKQHNAVNLESKPPRQKGGNQKQTLKYPRSVAFIISNEFCERFNYYGMRTILVLYLTRKLQYDDDTATVLFHVFTMLVYLFPLIGAVIADSWLGKFKTIFYLSIVYAIGGVIISAGAVPTLEMPVKAATIVGLVLIAIGTGGIKPCVSAFGGDQFRMPEQAKELARYFSLFYFAINAGSMISTSLTPILREDVHCFGDKDCFSLAFGVPAMLMLLSVIILVAGKSLYVMKPPAGNMLFGVTRCVSEAIATWYHERKTNPRKHILDYADEKCSLKLINDTKRLFKILVLFLPFPVFWALFDQQGSRWTFQATLMDGETWGYNIKPDQMQVVNPLLILAFIPLFDLLLYPLLAKLGIRRPLQKLTFGGLLAAVAFLISAYLETKLEATLPQLPGPMESQVRLYNGNPCRYNINTDLPYNSYRLNNYIEPLSLWEAKRIVNTQETSYKFTATTSENCSEVTGVLTLQPGKAMGFFLAGNHLYSFVDAPEKPKNGEPAVRLLLNMEDTKSIATLTDAADVTTSIHQHNTTELLHVVRGSSALKLNGSEVYRFETKVGGVYALIAHANANNEVTAHFKTITLPNAVHMMWQLPQIVVITAAEIMFSVTGLEFSFTQAPQSMKSVIQACWLLSVAIGNMLVVVIAELKAFKSQAAEFVLFAGLMAADMLLFMLLASRYQYSEQEREPELGDPEAPKSQIQNGHRANGSAPHNESYVNNAYT